MQDVNQVFWTKKKLAQNSADVVSSSVSSSSSKLPFTDFQIIILICLFDYAWC